MNRFLVRRVASGPLLILLLPSFGRALNIPSGADSAWKLYVEDVETRLGRQRADPGKYVAVLNCDPQTRSRLEGQLLSGAVLVSPVGSGTRAIDAALLHHWRADAFVPRATPEQMLNLLRDYDHLPKHYAPQVVSSHVVATNGRSSLIDVRTREQKIVTVVLDSEFHIENGLLSQERGYENSRSTHVWQVDNPGTPHEHRRPEKDSDGLLWRLNTYWTFTRWRDGLLVECETISLTRDIPTGLGWLITPLIQDVPRESLEFTMRRTEQALRKGER